MHSTFIFDCGNVLLHFSREHHLDVFVGDDPEDRKMVWDAVFTEWFKTDLDMSTNDYFEEVKAKLPPRLHKAAGNIIFHWMDETWPVEGMEQLILGLKRAGKRIILLSNMPDTFSNDHSSLPILDVFDDLVFSYLVRMVKPNRDIFEYVLRKHNLTPEECLFVDDLKTNIEAAKDLGIDTYLFNPENPDIFVKKIMKEELQPF